jgi:hypothetical protein
MAIDAGEAAIRKVIAEALIEHDEDSGRPLDALFAMRRAEAVVKASNAQAIRYAGRKYQRTAASVT